MLLILYIYIYIYILRLLFHLIGGLDDKIVNNIYSPPRILLLCLFIVFYFSIDIVWTR